MKLVIACLETNYNEKYLLNNIAQGIAQIENNNLFRPFYNP